MAAHDQRHARVVTTLVDVSGKGAQLDATGDDWIAGGTRYAAPDGR
jgi:hypothetical protein